MNKTETFYHTLKDLIIKTMELPVKESLIEVQEFLDTQKILKRTPKFTKSSLVSIIFYEKLLIEYDTCSDKEVFDMIYMPVNAFCLKERDITTDGVMNSILSLRRSSRITE